MQVDAELVDRIEALTREGQAKQVERLFASMSINSIPRNWRAKLAELARRNTLYMVSLRILNPIVHSEKELEKPATGEELMTYAGVLAFLGLSKEPLAILKKVDASENPEVYLQRAFAFFSERNYHAAIPQIRKYIIAPGLSEYRRLVGKVNLTAALISDGQLEEAQALVSSLNQITERENHTLLFANTCELWAQIRIQTGEYSNAMKLLDQAMEKFSDSNSIYYFFIKKWKAIAALLADPENQSLQNQLVTIQSEARERNHWETVRDCDLYLSFVRKDESLLEKAIWGTPSLLFRRQAEKLFGRELKKGPSYILSSHRSSHGIVNTFDLSSSRVLQLRKNKYAWALLLFLMEDFYRPRTLGQIFYKLYPDEYFNPQSSERRVLNQVGVLRSIIKAENIPLELHSKGYEYKLELIENSTICLHRQHYTSDSTLQFRTLREIFSSREFSTDQVAEIFGISPRSALTVLSGMVKKGLVLRIGRAKSARYRIQTWGRTKKSD